MYKIDKSTWDKMSSNKSKIIKQWMPEPHNVQRAAQQHAKNEVAEGKPDIVTMPQANIENVEDAKSEILQDALTEAEMIKQKAYEEGYSAGILQAQEKFEEIYKQQNTHLEEILNQVEIDKTQIISHFEKETLNLSLVIAEKILNMELESDDKVFVGIVKNTLDMMEQDEPLVLRLSTKEYEKHYKHKSEALLKELQCEAQITVVKDASLKPGALILESDKGFVDASVDTQLGRVADSLTQGDNRYHEAL